MSGNQLMLAGAPGAVANYIEDVFSTYLYTGNGSTQTITNNIDLSTKGGLVWIKQRSAGATNHALYDSARGIDKSLSSNLTDAQNTNIAGREITAFNTNGFSLGPNQSLEVNTSSATYASWTFREQPKFFDIVTYTGNGSNRTISHNLGSVPGCIIVKRTSTAKDWAVYHRSVGNTKYLTLNATSAASTVSTYWNDTDPTSTVFTVGTDGDVNANGETYVAYLFAHDAGGFGLTGSDNVITCGSFTTNGTGQATVTLNYEPQWLLLKPSSTTGNWLMVDTMRGWNVNATGNIQRLRANLPDAEDLGGQLNPTATGFQTSASGALVASHTYIYIAIRRGPMKTPTIATSVFTPFFNTQSAGTQNTTNFTVDTMFIRSPGGGENNHLVSRLQGVSSNTTDSGQYMYTQATNAEASGGITRYWSNIGFQTTSGYSGYAAIYLPFQRAPGFHDVVCYTGTGSNLTVNHNLGVAPELIIIKSRSNTSQWTVNYSFTASGCGEAGLNLNSAGVTLTYAAGPAVNAQPTSTQFQANSPTSSYTYVAYLFASLSGVSKIGTYTGTGTTLQVNCGFTGGARLIIIKRTDSTGDWYVYNSASGIVAGNDPYILLNSTAAEVTNTDYVDTYSAGFELSSTAPAGLNANGGSYLFLAIA